MTVSQPLKKKQKLDSGSSSSSKTLEISSLSRFENLPDKVLVMIFLYLDDESLKNMRLVSQKCLKVMNSSRAVMLRMPIYFDASNPNVSENLRNLKGKYKKVLVHVPDVTGNYIENFQAQASEYIKLPDLIQFSYMSPEGCISSFLYNRFVSFAAK